MLKKYFSAITIGFVFTGSVLATDLVNKDSKRYEVKVHNVGTLNTSIDGNNTKAQICSNACTIEVVGVGSVKITGKEKAVIIQNGKLSVQ